MCDNVLTPTDLNHHLCRTDTRHDATVRLSAWLLYLRNHSGANGRTTKTGNSGSGSSSSRFWSSWLALLPGPVEATNASGFWAPAELQQLQLEPYTVRHQLTHTGQTLAGCLCTAWCTLDDEMVHVLEYEQSM